MNSYALTIIYDEFAFKMKTILKIHCMRAACWCHLDLPDLQPLRCVVARRVWEEISQIIGFEIGPNFESVARCWLCNNKKFGIVNMITSAMFWSVWKLRNSLCF
jgi:hypothetical protein